MGDLSVWKARITGSDPVGNSSRSELTLTIERLVHICSFLVPQAKTTELVQPREGPFDNLGRRGRIKLHSASFSDHNNSSEQRGQTLGLYKGEVCYRL
jgi:hypothetical protein